MTNPENIEPYKMKPGETRNPDGRPKNALSFKTILRKIIEASENHEDFKNPISGKIEKQDQLTLIIWRLLQKARSGDLKAIEMMLDRVDGKPKQEIEHSGNKENPVAFKRLFDD